MQQAVRTDHLVTGASVPFSLAVASTTMAASISIVMLNAASCQQNGQTLARAATARTCALIVKAGGTAK